MKKLITLLAITISVGAFAQDRVVMDSSDVSVPSASATLVRTSQTPDKVELDFNHIQLTTRVCIDERTVAQTCYRNEDVYRRREVCRDVIVTPVPNGPTGPRYNPPGTPRRECHIVNERVGTRSVPYTCYSTQCYGWETRNAGTASDKVKIKFKNLPNLGGNEEETFSVTASQNGSDNSNIVYTIIPLKTINDRAYEVNKKGIFGYDSYVIEPK